MTGRAKQYLADLNGKYPNPEQAKELYRLRDLDVLDLQRKATITAADIETLTMHAKFRIANESFDKCDHEAQDVLRNDPHPGVRAAVVTFRPATPFKYFAASAA